MSQSKLTATPADIDKGWCVIDAEGLVLGRVINYCQQTSRKLSRLIHHIWIVVTMLSLLTLKRS